LGWCFLENTGSIVLFEEKVNELVEWDLLVRVGHGDSFGVIVLDKEAIEAIFILPTNQHEAFPKSDHFF
jgi:hypothetical protein